MVTLTDWDFHPNEDLMMSPVGARQQSGLSSAVAAPVAIMALAPTAAAKAARINFIFNDLPEERSNPCDPTVIASFPHELAHPIR